MSSTFWYRLFWAEQRQLSALVHSQLGSDPGQEMCEQMEKKLASVATVGVAGSGCEAGQA